MPSVAALIFTGPLAWTSTRPARARPTLFFAPAGERPEARDVREGKARRLPRAAPCSLDCRDWAREHREYGFWGGESEEERAAAGFRVDMPVGRVARYPRATASPSSPARPASPEHHAVYALRSALSASGTSRTLRRRDATPHGVDLDRLRPWFAAHVDGRHAGAAARPS